MSLRIDPHGEVGQQSDILSDRSGHYAAPCLLHASFWQFKNLTFRTLPPGSASCFNISPVNRKGRVQSASTKLRNVQRNYDLCC